MVVLAQLSLRLRTYEERRCVAQMRITVGDTCLLGQMPPEIQDEILYKLVSGEGCRVGDASDAERREKILRAFANVNKAQTLLFDRGMEEMFQILCERTGGEGKQPTGLWQFHYKRITSKTFQMLVDRNAHFACTRFDTATFLDLLRHGAHVTRSMLEAMLCKVPCLGRDLCKHDERCAHVLRTMVTVTSDEQMIALLASLLERCDLVTAIRNCLQLGMCRCLSVLLPWRARVDHARALAGKLNHLFHGSVDTYVANAAKDSAVSPRPTLEDVNRVYSLSYWQSRSSATACIEMRDFLHAGETHELGPTCIRCFVEALQRERQEASPTCAPTFYALDLKNMATFACLVTDVFETLDDFTSATGMTHARCGGEGPLATMTECGLLNRSVHFLSGQELRIYSLDDSTW